MKYKLLNGKMHLGITISSRRFENSIYKYGQYMGNDGFIKMLPRLKQHNLGGELIIKAARIRNHEGDLLAVDATAGTGEDSLLLAAFGFNVILFEQNPDIASVLRETMSFALQDERLSDIVKRMVLIEGDSIPAMRELGAVVSERKLGESFCKRADVILLDPMFPRRKKSALVKKKLQTLQMLEKPCENEQELLDAAFSAEPKKIIIKRPAKGPFLADRKPDYSIKGDIIRFDCFVRNT